MGAVRRSRPLRDPHGTHRDRGRSGRGDLRLRPRRAPRPSGRDVHGPAVIPQPGHRLGRRHVHGPGRRDLAGGIQRHRRGRRRPGRRRRPGPRGHRSRRRGALARERVEPQPIRQDRAHGPGQQSRRGRGEARSSGGCAAPADRNLVHDSGDSPGRRGLRPGGAHQPGRGPLPVDLGHRADGDGVRRGRARQGRRRDGRDGAGPEALLLSLSLRVERPALRVRDRLPGRRGDGLLAGPRSPQRPRSHRVRAHPWRPASREGRPARSAGDERARGGPVRRRAAPSRGHPSAGSRGLSGRGHGGAAARVQALGGARPARAWSGGRPRRLRRSRRRSRVSTAPIPKASGLAPFGATPRSTP